MRIKISIVGLDMRRGFRGGIIGADYGGRLLGLQD